MHKPMVCLPNRDIKNANGDFRLPLGRTCSLLIFIIEFL